MLPREVDPLVYNMSHEDPGNISYAQIGGLSEQIRELREVKIIFLFTVNTCISFPSVPRTPDIFYLRKTIQKLQTNCFLIKIFLFIYR